MIGALIRKELLEHRLHLALLWVIGGIVFVVKLGGDDQSGTAGSYFASLQGFLISVQIILTFFLCERLIHREYRAKTQLFLEALPLRRLDMLGVKFSFALLQVVLMVSLSLLVCTILAYERESLTFPFLGLLFLRALLASFFWFSFIFMMSLLGKYRIGLYFIVIILTITVHTNTAFDWWSFGPMDLLGARYAFERDIIPWISMAWTLGLSLVFCALGFTLGLIREGSVATLFAEKMNHREKIFVTIAIISTLMVMVFVTEDQTKESYDFPDYAQAFGEGYSVKFAVYPGVSQTEATNWAHWHQQTMDSLKQRLSIPTLPNTFVMMRRDFDGDKFERSDLEDFEGMILRANFGSSNFNQAEYEAWLKREILLITSNKRNGLEARRWVLDGFALFSLTLEQPIREELLWMRAAYGVPERITRKDLEQWLKFRTKVGDKVAMAVAYSGLKTLQTLTEKPPFKRFLEDALAKPVPEDFRALWHEKNHSVMKDLTAITEVSMEDFLNAWNRNLEQARLDFSSELAVIPRLDGKVEIQALTGHNRSLTYAAMVSNSDTGRPADDENFELRFQVLPLLAGQADPRLVQTVNLIGQNSQDCKLPGVFHSGQRVAVTLVHFSPVLACEVIGGWAICEVD